jgi:hypothetical protein
MPAHQYGRAVRVTGKPVARLHIEGGIPGIQIAHHAAHHAIDAESLRTVPIGKYSIVEASSLSSERSIIGQAAMSISGS